MTVRTVGAYCHRHQATACAHGPVSSPRAISYPLTPSLHSGQALSLSKGERAAGVLQRKTLCYWLFAWLLALGLVTAACSSVSSPTAPRPPTGTPPLNAIPAESEVIVGDRRFTFGLVGPDGKLVEGAQAHARFFRPTSNGAYELASEADAPFRQIVGHTPHHHENGGVDLTEEVKGVYIAGGLTFDKPGQWLARLQVVEPGKTAPEEAGLLFNVKPTSETLKVGDKAPATRNPTARDVVKDLGEITTHFPPVPGLYQLTVAEALQQGKPFVVAFATPAFCVSRMCGPVTDVVADVYQKYQDRANFIHIEPYDLNIQRTQGKLELGAAAREWNLPSEPWVFVVDKTGHIAARYEGLVTADELSAALDAVL